MNLAHVTAVLATLGVTVKKVSSCKCTHVLILSVLVSFGGLLYACKWT